MPNKLLKFPPPATGQQLLAALKESLRGLEAVRIIAGPEEARMLAELKRSIRTRIAQLENPPEEVAAD